MTKRSITDREISLIKAMLARKMLNKDIQFFFNRPDRAVNSGRITGISAGTYGQSSLISAATDDELDGFLAEFQPPGVSASINVPVANASDQQQSPTASAVILSLFLRDSEGVWRLKNGESDQHECKTNFGFKHCGPWIRAIAALANNRGGYILFGVHDKDTQCKDGIDRSYAVLGLSSDEFVNADPVEITKRVKSALDPTPRIHITTETIEDKKVGVIFVEQHPGRPVIATKNDGDQVKEGDIFFRYTAQSARIKYSDLRTLLDERDANARRDILPLVDKLLTLGPGRALIADLEAGVLSDGQRPIMIDKNLVDQLKFIKEGEFNEAEGAPTLRLVGDVRAADGIAQVINNVFVTRDDIIRDFVKQESPSNPLEYIRCAVEGGKGDWMPIHYFAMKAGLNQDGLTSCIEATSATASRKKLFIERAQGARTAHKASSGTPLLIQNGIESGTLPDMSTEIDPANVGLAICGLTSKPYPDPKTLLDTVGKCMDASKGDTRGVRMSILRRAICRIDELYFTPSL